MYVRFHLEKLVLELNIDVCKSLADKLHQPAELSADMKLQCESVGLEQFISLQASPHLKPSRLGQKSILTGGEKEKGKQTPQ